MLCQNCGKNEANVRYTQIINGVKKEINVCEKCAQELGLEKMSFNMPLNFSSFLGDFFENYQSNDILSEFTGSSNTKCKTCLEDFQDFVNTGLLGCPDCYETFQDKLDPILKNMQGAVNHTGRRIKNNKIDQKINIVKDVKENEFINDKNETEKNQDEPKTSKEKIEVLQDNLKGAIKDERYEDAAKIRDEIKKLEENK